MRGKPSSSCSPETPGRIYGCSKAERKRRASSSKGVKCRELWWQESVVRPDLQNQELVCGGGAMCQTCKNTFANPQLPCWSGGSRLRKAPSPSRCWPVLSECTNGSTSSLNMLVWYDRKSISSESIVCLCLFRIFLFALLVANNPSGFGAIPHNT